VPPVRPLLPDLGAAGGPGRTPVGPSRWRIAEPKLGHRALHGVYGVQPGPAEQPLLADPVEQIGAHVLQVRAAVGQHQLRDGHRQQGVLGAAELIAPAGQYLAEPGEPDVDQVAAEHPPARHQPLEAAEAVELAEPAEQERVRGKVGPHLVTDPARRARPELDLRGPEQIDPVVGGPVPVGAAAGLRAAGQQPGNDVQHRAAPMRGRRRIQPGVDRVQRPKQSGDGPPARRGGIAGLEPAQVGHPELDDRGGLLGADDDPQPRPGDWWTPLRRTSRLRLPQR
jgi:hypothetical protein